VLGHQPNAPADFTPGEIPGTHFQRLSRPQGTWFCRKQPRKKSPVTPPGIDPGTVRLVPLRYPRPLNTTVVQDFVIYTHQAVKQLPNTSIYCRIRIYLHCYSVV